MKEVKHGDMVKIHYTGKLEDGSVFGSTSDRDPLTFKIGEDQIIQGIEKAVVGMKQNEAKTITIAPDDAFGRYHKEMVIKVPKDKFPPHMQPTIGRKVQIPQRDGQSVEATVTEISETQVTLDANHPLAGKNLVFDIQLVEIV